MRTKAEFFLIGYYNKNDFNLTYKSFDINFLLINREIQKKPDILDKKETVCLSIIGSGEKFIFLELALNIKNLLSLAFGRRIIFNRQVYTIDDNREEVFKEMSDPLNEGKQIIPEFKIDKFLDQTLTKYELFTKDEKNQFFIVTDYLNQTKHGFIEDRILHTAIAWESLADHFKVNSKLPSHLIDLRKMIKNSYNVWKKNNSELDPNGEIGSKLLTSIDREKLIDKLFNLANKFNLDYQKLGIDFYKLKELRNMVAHTGRMNITGKKAYKIMDPAIKGLQIILLSWLGYSSLINSSKDGWRTFDPITDFKS